MFKYCDNYKTMKDIYQTPLQKWKIIKNKILFQIISIYYFNNSDIWSQYYSSALAILA